MTPHRTQQDFPRPEMLAKMRSYARRTAVRRHLGRLVRPFVTALEWLTWKPVCLSNYIVGELHRRNIAPHLYRPDDSPLRRLHIRLVKMWMPFFRGRPNTEISGRAGSVESSTKGHQ